MVHGAMYDAVAAVEGGLEPFATRVTSPPGASADAAVAQAAHDVLVARVPGQAATSRSPTTPTWPRFRPGLRRMRARLSAWPQRPACSRRGPAITSTTSFRTSSSRRAQACSSRSRRRRSVDPKLQFVRPFTYASPSDYRPGPPVELTSKRYAEDVAELQTYGRFDSTARSALQTETVRFHTEQTYLQFSRTLRELAMDRGLDLRESARLLGYVNVATADTMIACWEAKYHYNFWRPNHAIQRADTDGNPATTKDTTWLPLVVGNHPGVSVRPLLLHRFCDRVAASVLRDEEGRARDHEPRSRCRPAADVREPGRARRGRRERARLGRPPLPLDDGADQPSTSRGSPVTWARSTS